MVAYQSGVCSCGAGRIPNPYMVVVLYPPGVCGCGHMCNCVGIPTKCLWSRIPVYVVVIAYPSGVCGCGRCGGIPV